MLLLTERSEQEGGFIVVHRGSIPPLSISHSLSVSLPISLFVSLSQSLSISLVDIIAIWGAEIKETPLSFQQQKRKISGPPPSIFWQPLRLLITYPRRDQNGARGKRYDKACAPALPFPPLCLVHGQRTSSCSSSPFPVSASASSAA